MRYVIIGIDIGNDGAIVVQHRTGLKSSHPIVCHRMPVKGSKKPSVDIARLRDILSPHVGQDTLVIYERIGQIFQSTKATAFSMGYQRGVIESLCVSLNLPYLDVPPKEWQSEMFIGTPEMKTKDDKRDTKGMSAVAARRLHPELDLTFPGMKKPFHDGLCDALLIGDYAIRKNL